MDTDYRMMTYRDASGAEVRRPRTATEQLVAEYQDRGEPFSIIHRVVHSTRPWKFEIVDPRPTAAPLYAFMRCTDTDKSYFTYAQNQTYDLALSSGFTRPATLADTSLTNARQTPNQDDLAINALSFRIKSLRVEYSEAAVNQAIANSGGGVVSDQVRAALLGRIPIVDPGSLVMFPQVDSPYNLARPLDALMRHHLAFTMVWRNSVQVYHGLGAHIPAAGAVPYLHAQGDPRLDNALMIPEGYMWRRSGAERDNELEIMVSLKSPLVVPVNLLSLPLLGASFDGLAPLPLNILVDFALDLHCVAISTVSQNAG